MEGIERLLPELIDAIAKEEATIAQIISTKENLDEIVDILSVLTEKQKAIANILELAIKLMNVGESHSKHVNPLPAPWLSQRFDSKKD